MEDLCVQGSLDHLCTLDLGDLDDLRVLDILKGQDSSLLIQIAKKLAR